MKLQLKNKSTIPYGGNWYYKDPHSGQEFRFYQFAGLVDKVRAHRQANNYPIGLEFEEEIETQVCMNHPDEAQPYPDHIPKRVQLNLQDIIRGSTVMMQFYAAGKPLVSREEAERRAQICIKCPMNDDFSKPCSIGICGELKQIVASVINSVGTQYDSKLRSCRLCKCFLQASIQLPLEIQCSGVTAEMKEQFKFAKEQWGCWKQCE